VFVELLGVSKLLSDHRAQGFGFQDAGLPSKAEHPARDLGGATNVHHQLEPTFDGRQLLGGVPAPPLYESCDLLAEADPHANGITADQTEGALVELRGMEIGGVLKGVPLEPLDVGKSVEREGANRVVLVAPAGESRRRSDRRASALSSTLSTRSTSAMPGPHPFPSSRP
jgi:hypothetical protein